MDFLWMVDWKIEGDGLCVHVDFENVLHFIVQLDIPIKVSLLISKLCFDSCISSDSSQMRKLSGGSQVTFASAGEMNFQI
jgi:hypothetical protein